MIAISLASTASDLVMASFCLLKLRDLSSSWIVMLLVQKQTALVQTTSICQIEVLLAVARIIAVAADLDLVIGVNVRSNSGSEGVL